MKLQPPKIVDLVLQQDPQLLDRVKEQTEEMCLRVVQANHHCLLRVKKQTVKIILSAIQQEKDGLLLHSIKWHQLNDVEALFIVRKLRKKTWNLPG